MERFVSPGHGHSLIYLFYVISYLSIPRKGLVGREGKEGKEGRCFRRPSTPLLLEFVGFGIVETLNGDVIYDLILEALSLIDVLMLQWAWIGNGLIGRERIKVTRRSRRREMEKGNEGSNVFRISLTYDGTV